MARPTKAGLDYFELDCQLEEKVRLIQAEYGLKGFAIVVKLYQKIYGELGYYCEWNDDSLLLFMSENGLPSDNKNLIQSIVDACIRRNIFSQQLFDKFGILTSEGIQKRYLNATSRREKVEMKKEYLLLSVGNNTNNVCINSINVNRNSVNVCRNTQSRVEESKVEKSKENKYSSETKAIVEYLNSKCGTNYKYTSDNTRRNIRARLEDGYTVEDFYTVIDKKANDWIGTDMQEYLRPITLFGTKFESYLNQPVKQKRKGWENTLDETYAMMANWAQGGDGQ